MENEFQRRLAECIAWCSHRVDPHRACETTRSRELQPPLFDEGAHDPLDLLLSPGQALASLEHVVQRRRRALEAQGALPLTYDGLSGGRVFATDFNTDQCGASQEPSNGLLDIDDIPGWDTWFAQEPTREPTGIVVYCWVPGTLVELAEAGMNVIPVNCVWWVSEPELARLLSGG